MSLQVEKLENNTAKLTIEVEASKFDKAIQKAYQKNKNKFNIPGFRKGKVPYAMVEKMYGAAVFYEDAANELISGAYAQAAEESGLEIVARPEINVTQIEKGKPFIFEAEVTTKPEVKLGKYKGIKVEKADVTVTDEEVADYVNNIRAEYEGKKVDETSLKQIDEIIAQFDSPEDYWKYEKTIYHELLPMIKYNKQLEKEYNEKHADASEEDWEKYFNNYKSELVEKEDFKLVK